MNFCYPSRLFAITVRTAILLSFCGVALAAPQKPGDQLPNTHILHDPDDDIERTANRDVKKKNEPESIGQQGNSRSESSGGSEPGTAAESKLRRNIKQKSNLTAKPDPEKRESTQLIPEEPQRLSPQQILPISSTANGLVLPDFLSSPSSLRVLPFVFLGAALLTIAMGTIWIFFRRKRLLGLALKTDTRAQETMLHPLCKSKRKRKSTEGQILNIYHQCNEVSIRVRAIQALFSIADKYGYRNEKLKYLSMGMQDDAFVVRRATLDKAIQHPDPETMLYLEKQISCEGNSELGDAITSAVINWKKQDMNAAFSAEDFERAEQRVRELLPLGYEPNKADNTYNRISAMRQRKANREMAEQHRSRQREASNLLANAAKKIEDQECDAAEDLLRKALGSDPMNKDAQALLKDIPNLRKTLDEATIAKNLSTLTQKIERYKLRVIKCIEEGELQEASSALISVAGLAPNDPWAKQALEDMPRLQAEQDRAKHTQQSEELKARSNQLRKKLYENWNDGDLENAKKTVDEIISLSPDDNDMLAFKQRIIEATREAQARSWRKQVQDELTAGDLDKAEESLRTLLSLGEDDGYVNQVLQRLPDLRQQQLKAQARAAAIEREDSFREKYTVVKALFEESEFVRAEQEAMELVTLKPNDPRAVAFQERITEALRQQKAEEIWNDIQEALSTGQIRKAEKKVAELTAYDVDQERSERLLQKLPLLRKEQAEAKKQAEAQRKCNQSQKLRKQAEKLLDEADFSGASKKIGEAIKLTPGNPELDSLQVHISTVQRRCEAEKLFQASMGHLKKGDFDTAESCLRSLLPIVDDSTKIHKLLGDMPDIRGKYQMSLDTAADINDKNSSYEVYTEAQQLFEYGDFTACAQKLRKAIAKDPANDLASSLLKRVFEFEAFAPSQNTVKATQLDSYGQIHE